MSACNMFRNIVYTSILISFFSHTYNEFNSLKQTTFKEIKNLTCLPHEKAGFGVDFGGLEKSEPF